MKTVKRLLNVPSPRTLKGIRDRSILYLLCENALRRAELCALDVGDFSARERRLMVQGKGRGTQKEPVTLSERLVAMLVEYVEGSGHGEKAEAPLFLSAARWNKDKHERLTHDGLFRLVRGYGKRIGVELTPHKLRHSAITAALDATGGDVRTVQRLSRHADIRTLTIYDDNREDLQGKVTNILAQIF